MFARVASAAVRPTTVRACLPNSSTGIVRGEERTFVTCLCSLSCAGTIEEMLASLSGAEGSHSAAWNTVPPCGGTMLLRVSMFITASLWVDLATWVICHYSFTYVQLLRNTEFLMRVRRKYLPKTFVRSLHVRHVVLDYFSNSLNSVCFSWFIYSSTKLK